MVYRYYFSWRRWCTATNRPGGGTAPFKNHLHNTITALSDFGVRMGFILLEKRGRARRYMTIGQILEISDLGRF
jgi:hypothetical protein